MGRFAPRRKYSRLSAEEAFFFKKLQEAKNQLDEMEQILEALGRKLDAAKIDEEVDVDSEVDAIEALIWRHNDALESAREVWLRHDLGSRAFDRLTLMYSPAAFGLPLFTDEQQAERARVQWHKIARRLDQRIATFDRIILGMKVVEAAGVAASLTLGAGVVMTAFKQGGKWAVVKTVAKVAASGAAAYSVGEGVEHGLAEAATSWRQGPSATDKRFSGDRARANGSRTTRKVGRDTSQTSTWRARIQTKVTDADQSRKKVS